jgi:hypothetical protein
MRPIAVMNALYDRYSCIRERCSRSFSWLRAPASGVDDPFAGAHGHDILGRAVDTKTWSRSGPIGLLRWLGILATAGSFVLAQPETPPVRPTETIVLFDGQKVSDLSRFYTWLAAHGKEDPNRVFSVVDAIDGQPAIRVSGQDFGGLMTRESYADYKLVAEFRWGSTTWGKRRNAARNSGVLLHCIGEDGNHAADFRSPWISSIEYEIQEGNMGTIILVPGHKRNSAERYRTRITIPVQPEGRTWDPAGTPREFVSGQGHLYWQHRAPDWKDVLDFRGPRDPDRPVGEWNLVEVIADRDRLVYFLNGHKIMEGANCWPTSGPLLFQSEGAEIFFRRIELQSLPPARG